MSKEVFERIRNVHQRSIDLIDGGYKTTREVRDGKSVDTTQETRADDARIVGDMDKALERLGD